MLFLFAAIGCGGPVVAASRVVSVDVVSSSFFFSAGRGGCAVVSPTVGVIVDGACFGCGGAVSVAAPLFRRRSNHQTI